MEPGILLGLALAIVILLCLRKRFQRRGQLPQPSGDQEKNLGFDTSIRANTEKALRDQGIIGGSRLNAAHGFETAYRRIMAGVQADDGIKADLYAALAQNPSAETCEKFLLSGEWEWPEFDKWKKIFLDDGKFPYMWAKYPEICMMNFEDFQMTAMLERTNMKVIKEIFQNLQIDIPSKIKKYELLEIANKKINIKVLQEKCPDIYINIKNEFNHRVNHGKCVIFAHTIIMLGYHLQDFYTNKQLKIDIIKGCPVEAKYAKGKGKISESNIPPFFPGDRTGVKYILK
ncbi:MAG: hypothetical protein J1E80_06580 [Desulfovibrionaceae bacterium]|nr:hypothetical protein [Desulfovibrionaceae bacterium]